ncbi:MAG: C40 family peptidase, partial [Acidimicrobiales bacterium]
QGQIKTLVAQAQAAAAAAAQQAALQRILTAQQQQEFAGPPPPVGSGAGGAVAAAESRIGLPYVWAAAGPEDFDCSGLVMWAYAQVGISLPHYSGDQYADTVHISMANLEPGDLVFPSDPGEHVAMYIGNGEVVQAPYTGALVSTSPLSSFFVLASRVG